MKSDAFFCAIVALATLVPAIGRGADPADETQIRKIEQDWIDALVKRDGTYLTNLEADDYTFTGPDGAVVDKQADIKNATGGDTIFDDFKIDSIQVRFYGDAAIANGVGTIKGHVKGQDIGGQYSWTDVFAKRGGEWKAVAAQVTAVQKK